MATTVITTTTTTITATTMVTMVTVMEPPTQMQLALPTGMGITSSYPARGAMVASTAMPRASSAVAPTFAAATTTRRHTTNISSICSSNRRNRYMQQASMGLAPPPRITTSCSSRNTVAASMATQHPLLAPLPARALCPVRVAPIWSTSSWCCRLCRPVFQTNHKMASRISSSRPSI